MEEKKNLLTYAGLKKLEEELHDLKVVKRKEVAGKIKEAREQGDLSENAEYDAAKDCLLYTSHVKRNKKTYYFVHPKSTIFVPDTEKCPFLWLLLLRYLLMKH